MGVSARPEYLISPQFVSYSLLGEVTLPKDSLQILELLVSEVLQLCVSLCVLELEKTERSLPSGRLPNYPVLSS